MKIALFVTVLLFSTSVFLFQNCSKGGFTLTDDAQFRSDCDMDPSISEDCYNREEEVIDKNLGDINNATAENPTDILFVLDNSISMEVIADAVRDGFNSLASGQYPPETKMAVTYMSPAKVNEDGSIDYSDAYPSLIAETKALILNSPGYMDFVTKDGLDSFRNNLPTLLAKTVAFNYNISITEFTALYPTIDYNDPKNGIVKKTDNLTLTLKYNPAYPMTDTKRNTNPNAVEAREKVFATKLAKPGCVADWFNPKDIDSAGFSCLTAAVQLAPIGTGVEAGIVSLEQFLKKATSENRKLFRDKAKINIVLVSDTHESGFEDETSLTDLYFGTVGARKVRPVLGDLQSAILENNPMITSFKIHGIVPLPEVGNPLLQGLRTSGALPTDASQSKVGSELLNGFAYLPFIRDTAGLAVHAANNNWSTVAQSIVEETKFTGNVIVSTKQKIKKILSVTVNDVKYDLTQIVLSSDLKSFSIKLNQSAVTQLKITVDYQRLD